MRKFTSLFLLLTIFLGTVKGQVVNNLSDLRNDKVYTIKSGRSEGPHLLYHTDAPNNLSSTWTNGHAMPFDKTTKNFQFAIYNFEGKYYFYNMEAGKFIGNSNENNGIIPMVAEPTNDVEIRTRANQQSFIFMLSTNRKGALNVANLQGKHGVVNWAGGYGATNDSGNIYEIEAVADLSQTEQTQIQNKIQLLIIRQIVSEASNTNVGAYTETSVAEMKTALQNYDTNKNEANLAALKAAYNKLKESPSAKVTLSDGDIFKIKCADTNRGYLVYSQVASNGSEKYPWIVGADRGGYPTAGTAGVYDEWTLFSSNGKLFLYNVQKQDFLTPSKTSHILFEFTGTDYVNSQLTIEAQSNCKHSLKFGNTYLELSPGWAKENGVRQIGSINDDGTRFFLEKVNKTVDEQAKTAMRDKLVSYWKSVELGLLGQVGIGYSHSLKAEIENLKSIAELDQFVKTHNKDLKAGYYFICNTGVPGGVWSENNSDWRLTYNGSNCQALPVNNGKKLGAEHVWYLQPSGNGFKMQSCNVGKFLGDLAIAPNVTSIAADETNASVFTFTNNEGKFIIKDGKNNILRTENEGEVNTWSHESNESWYLVEAVDLELTIGNGGYSTIHFPFAVGLPADGSVSAYAIENVDNTKSTVALVNKTEVPANQGAILQGAANQAYTLTITPKDAAAAAAVSDWSNNMLKGSNVKTLIEGQAYILANPANANGVGLYKTLLNKNAQGQAVQTGGTHFHNNANRAYLPIAKQGPAAVQFYGFEFNEDGTTGIENIEDAIINNGNAVIFDLSGRRVQNTTKGGIYIVNGKKVVR